MSSDAVAIFLDEEELAQLVEGWPEGMRLAICLDEDGGCAMVVHHHSEDDEDGRVLRRVGEALGRESGGFAVVPARPGLPTRRMMFSEERMLMRLVADSDDLLEFASDYALNYAFAAEEGLDVEAVVTGRNRATPRPAPRPAAPTTAPVAETAPEPEAAPEPAPAQAAATAPDDMPEAFSSMRSQAWHAAEDTFAQEAPAASAPRLPEGFRALGPDEQHYSLFTEAVLSLGSSGRVRLTTGEAAPDDPGLKIGEIYFRDDLLSFAIPIRALAGCEQLPAKIVLDEGLLPQAMVSSLAQGPQAVRLTATGAYLFVGLTQARPILTEPAIPARAPHKPRRSRAARLLRGGLGGGTLVAGILLVLQLGLAPAFSHTDTKPAQPSLRDRIFARVGP